MINKEEIYVIGTGGFAKEVYFLIKETNLYKFKGFIGYKPKTNHLIIGSNSNPIIDEEKFLSKYKNSNIVIGTGRPHLLKQLSEKFKNFKTPNIIHPNFTSDKENINMGVGNIITAGVIFTTDITIGSFNVFNLNTTVGHDVVIGNYNVFNPSVNISGNSNIGDKNLFGVGSIVLENLKIENNNILGASSLLRTNINSNAVYVGAPATYLKINQ